MNDEFQTGGWIKDAAILVAAENMDWQQVVLNGGPPCFHICEEGHFCGRAQRWEGHGDLHAFVSLADLLRSIGPNAVEATLPRVEERTADDTMVELAPGCRIDLGEACERILAEAYERADRAIAIQVEKGVLRPGAALAVLHQYAEALSRGRSADFRDRLIPHLTEAAAATQIQ